MAKAKKVEAVEAVEADVQVEAPKKGKFSADVKAVVVKYPHVHTIHLNDKGEWHFMPKPGFTAYSREEILNG